MPSLALPRPLRDDLVTSAGRRRDAVLAGNPELAAAVDLQGRLLTRVIDLADAIERGRPPRLSLPPRYLAAKLASGVPILSGEPIPLPVALLTPALVGFCQDLGQGGAGEAATHIARALESGELDGGSLATASLARNQDAVRTGALHRGLSPDLLWLVGELAASPAAHALQRRLLAAAPGTPLAQATAAWQQGYCPACGSWPALAEVVDGRRVLLCSFCAAAWELEGPRCIYCGESGDLFERVTPDERRPCHRLQVCRACTGYLKEADRSEISPFPLASITDLETTDLDVTAFERRLGRPPMKSFAGRP